MSAPPNLLLLGLLRALNERGLALSTRDYLDALRALEFGFGCGGRQDLQALIITLWARSGEEERLIRRVFAEIPRPRPEELRLFEPDPTPHEATGEATAPIQRPTRRGTTAGSEVSSSDEKAQVSFETRPAKSGIPLPVAPRQVVGPDSFLLEPQTVIARRRLAVIWRRFRKMSPTGVGIELDIDACISEQCRDGALRVPIFQPERVNLARLAILADVSPSMSPWRPFICAVSDSLALSGMRKARMNYFDNDPLDRVSADSLMPHGEPTNDFLRRCEGSSLLIISDAGAARGFFNPERLQRTKRFLENAHRVCSAIVWIIPMPCARWAKTTAGAVAKLRSATFLPLSEDMLLRGVDILRGTRSEAA